MFKQNPLVKVTIILGFIYFAKSFLIPLAFSLLLFILIRPLCRYVEKCRIPRFVSATVSVTLILAVFVGLILFLVAPAKNLVMDAPQRVSLISEKISFLKKPYEKLLKASEVIENLSDRQSTEKKHINVSMSEQSSISRVFGFTSSFVGSMFTSLLLLFFLLLYGDRLIEKISENTKGKQVDTFIEAVEEGVSTYLYTIGVINLFLCVAIGFALWLCGLPNPFFFGVLAGILNFVPYIGPIVGVACVLFVAVLEFHSVYLMILPAVIYFVINSIEGQFVTPYFLGKSLQLNPLIILVVLLFSGWFWGIVGMIISIPCLTIFKIVLEKTDKLEKISEIISL